MEKTKSGKWRERIRYERKGKIYQKSFTAPTKAEVKRQIDAFKTDLVLLAKDDEKHPTMTVGEAMDQYISCKEGVLSPSTVREYQRIRDKHIRSIEGIDASLITAAELQSFVSNIALTHSAKTTCNIYTLVKSALEMAAPDRRFNATLPKRGEVKRTVPTDTQVKELIEAAPEDLKIAIVLGSYSMRRSEVCALRYKDIYPDLSSIYVHRGCVQNKNDTWIYKDMPKNASSIRMIRVAPEVIEMIGSGDPDELIFKHSPNYVSHAFTTVRDRLGIDVSFHSLRRYCASILHAMGIPDKYIQSVGGWSSPGVMRACYEQVMDDKALEFNKRMNEHYQDAFLATEKEIGTKSKKGTA